MVKGLIAATALAIAWALPVSAQDVIGRALVDGKMVEIMSDRTWRFQGEDGGATTDAADNGCEAIHQAVTFCIDPNLWEPSPPAGPDITAAYRHDDRHYAQFVIETFGTDDGITEEFMRDIVIQNAAGATGQRKEDIVILGIEPGEISGKPAETIIYQVEFDGLKVVFVNSIQLLPGLTMQAITYAISTEYTDKHQGLHQVLLENTQLN